ncbi:MAG: hypothetical protein ACKVP0_18180 [Pirellulaceae bacterium]
MCNSVWKFVGLLVVAFLAVGCGSGGPPTYKAVGTVTYKGQPVAGATLIFTYENSTTATGFTDTAGKFQLIALGSNKGATAGKGVLTVTKFPEAAAAPAAMGPKLDKVDPKTMDPKKMAEEMQAKRSQMDPSKNPSTTSAPKNELPAKYADPATSGLNFEILPKNDNNFTVDLKD